MRSITKVLWSPVQRNAPAFAGPLHCESGWLLYSSAIPQSLRVRYCFYWLWNSLTSLPGMRLLGKPIHGKGYAWSKKGNVSHLPSKHHGGDHECLHLPKTILQTVFSHINLTTTKRRDPSHSGAKDSSVIRRAISQPLLCYAVCLNPTNLKG